MSYSSMTLLIRGELISCRRSDRGKSCAVLRKISQLSKRLSLIQLHKKGRGIPVRLLPSNG